MSRLIAKIVKVCCKTAAYLNDSEPVAAPDLVPAP
jgi:hypothetical protein